MSTNLIREFFDSSQLAGGNADYVESLYDAWLTDAATVPAEWAGYFETFKGRESGDVPHGAAIARVEAAQQRRQNGATAVPMSDEYARKQAGVLRLLTAYRSRGHLAANLDPLGLAAKMSAPDLSLPFHGLSDADLDTEFDTGNYAGGGKRLKLRTLLERLHKTYASTIGAEFMHISNHEQRNWIYSRLEQQAGEAGLDKAGKQRVLDGLTAAEGLERYLHTKYVGQKRFSLEGGDSLIPMIDDVVRAAGDNGVKELVIGMAHRGRLNMLVNILGKPPKTLFDEFEGKFDHPDDPAHSGDVKYHMGFSADVKTPNGGVHVALAFNPSHLEVVNPVVTGSVHARQTRRRDTMHKQSMAVLIHGDAAFAGQGVNMELFNMSQARGFKIGGSLHIVINNQVGFTTSNPQDARSTMYCTDLAKMVNAPVLHVNGDDPEAVILVTRLAYDFRVQFRRDVVIDLVCYRRHGHNEADEPAATQPMMYKIIRKRPTTRELYQQELVKQGVLAEGDAKKQFDAYRDRLEAGDPMTDLDPSPARDSHVDWSRFLGGKLSMPTDTTVPMEKLHALADRILTLPADLTLQARVAKIYDDRRKMAAGEQPADWGFAENLAYATLVDAGYDMRLVGQDTGRGTFFHRHAVLHDQTDGHTYMPLSTVRDTADVEVIDSLLSECAVMAFEYGHSTTDPDTLNIWEAQFGDFANGAQVVIDQFISSGEAKWNRLCGLVLLLPHGYEGQGPEHSSARLERYLQLCAMDNMQVCVPTTPAQDFHMIRRQMLRNVRKPLIVMTPKSLLRHKLAVSSLDELANGSFQLVIGEHRKLAAKKVKRVVLCSGKVYYDLLEEAEKRELKDVALVRVEQLYPFPRPEVTAVLDSYPAAKEVIWCQEEPMNQGAWFQIRHHLQACTGTSHSLSYAGRARSPAPAAGHHNTHVAEQVALVEQALVGVVDDDHSTELSSFAPRGQQGRLVRFSRARASTQTPRVAMSIELKVPVLPESVSDATIASWHKQAGDAVKRDENLVDLETDKVVLEVPSPVDGVLKEIRHEVGDTVNSEQVIAIIEEGAAATPAKDEPKGEDKAPAKAAAAKADAPKASSKGTEDLSPAGRRVATEENIDASKVSGTGRDGRVTKEDLVNYGKGGGAAPSAAPAAKPTPGSRPEERVPMTRMRARIAERLMQSKNSIAMLTSFNEVNLAEVVKMRKSLGEAFQKEHGIKLGFMSFFVKAAAEALKRYPYVNASVDGNDVIYHGYQDISIAVSTDKGLVTPVLRDVQDMGFADVEKAIADYATKARNNKLTLDDLQGGTFTITNGGTFGSLLSTPIVNPPQSAILGMHTIKERAIVENGQIIAAPMMYIAISYDHRIINGKDAVLFLVDIKNQLENPQRMLLGL